MGRIPAPNPKAGGGWILDGEGAGERMHSVVSDPEGWVALGQEEKDGTEWKLMGDTKKNPIPSWDRVSL